MTSQPLPKEQILTMLADAPQRISALIGGLAADQLHTAPGVGEWSANEVLAHMRSCSDVWGNCIKEILIVDMPTIKAINPRTWIKRTDYLVLEFRHSLDFFTNQRAELLSVLEPLTTDDWSRAGNVTGAGKPLVRTVHGYAQWLAAHERPHIKQIGRIANAARLQQ